MMPSRLMAELRTPALVDPRSALTHSSRFLTFMAASPKSVTAPLIQFRASLKICAGRVCVWGGGGGAGRGQGFRVCLHPPRHHHSSTPIIEKESRTLSSPKTRLKTEK